MLIVIDYGVLEGTLPLVTSGLLGSRYQLFRLGISKVLRTARKVLWAQKWKRYELIIQTIVKVLTR